MFGKENACMIPGLEHIMVIVLVNASENANSIIIVCADLIHQMFISINSNDSIHRALVTAFSYDMSHCSLLTTGSKSCTTP